MEVIKTALEGVVIIEPRIFKDARGYFFESFSQKEFDEKVMPINFVQDNESMSSYGVMRGLHYQRMPYTQSKLVRCVKGTVLDVVVDIRKGSPTFGATCIGRTYRGESSPAIHSPRFRPRFCSAERDSNFPIQVRQLLCTASRRRHTVA